MICRPCRQGGGTSPFERLSATMTVGSWHHLLSGFRLIPACQMNFWTFGINVPNSVVFTSCFKAIPSDQQQALITARELTSTALLYRLLIRYQPGGAGEKAILLAKLTTLDKANGAPELAATLRSRRRHFARAQEVGAVLPDGTLLLKALEPAVTQISAMDSQAASRLAQSRLQLGVDQQPHHGGVWRFSQCLLAELETLSLLSTTPSTSSTPVKVKQLEAQTKTSGAAHGGGDKDKGKGTSAVNLPSRLHFIQYRWEAVCFKWYNLHFNPGQASGDGRAMLWRWYSCIRGWATGGKGETGATSGETLLQEATKLLKSLSAPQLRVIKVSQLDMIAVEQQCFWIQVQLMR